VQVSVRMGQFGARGRLVPADLAVAGPSWSAVSVIPAADEPGALVSEQQPVVEHHDVVGQAGAPTGATLLAEVVGRNEPGRLLATLRDEALRLLLAMLPGETLRLLLATLSDETLRLRLAAVRAESEALSGGAATTSPSLGVPPVADAFVAGEALPAAIAALA